MFPWLNWAYALLAPAVLVAAAATYLPLGQHRRLLALVVGGASLIPLGEYGSAAMNIRGILGDLSVTLFQLACIRLIWGNRPSVFNQRAVPNLLLGMIAVFGMVYYPLALGIGALDIYASGYLPGGPLLAVLALSTYLLWQKQTLLLAMLGLDVLAYSVGLSSSSNLWDYLLDPLLWGMCCYKGFLTLVPKR